jgi:hypothetical protein
MWNTRYFILPTVPHNDEKRAFYSLVPETDRVVPAPDAFETDDGHKREREWNLTHDWQLRRNRNAFPRAWVVHKARQFPPIRGNRRIDRQHMMYEILYQDDPFWHMTDRTVYDPRQIAWVESDDPITLAKFLSGARGSANDVVRIVKYEPQRIEIEADLADPGLVVLADVHYPGWELTLDGTPATIYRTNRMMRGAAVPRGKHLLVYTYHPRSFIMGAAISVIAVIAAIVACAWIWRSPSRLTAEASNAE